jgi:hypothetical protein
LQQPSRRLTPDLALAFYRDALGLELRNDVAREGSRRITVGAASQPGVAIRRIWAAKTRRWTAGVPPALANVGLVAPAHPHNQPVRPPASDRRPASCRRWLHHRAGLP